MRQSRSFVSWFACVALVLFATGHALAQQTQPDPGRKLYQEHCASCHGAAGQGGDGFSDPLVGDLSLPELTRYVDETMPDGDPEAVAGEQAQQVSQFVFDQFYSEPARRRAAQPRIELARLTVNQYRNSVADLIATFSPPVSQSDERGLKASYFAARRRSQERKIADQTDAVLDFPDAVPHFDPTGEYESVPKPEKKPANKMNDGFSAYWHGGILAPATGEYEIKVKSKNGFRLYLNDPRNPLIDRYVRSDDVVDHAAKIHLLGGRVYLFRLDFFSYPHPPAKLQVLWTPPGEPEQVIPARVFTSYQAPETLVIATPFPPDDASAGYVRGTDISAAWDRATTDAAIEAAEWVASRIQQLARFRVTDENAVEKARQFCMTFVARALITELSDSDLERYVGQHFEQDDLSIEDQVRRVVLMTLKSPRFLFRHLERRDPSHEGASLLAETLWDSVPSQSLLQAAGQHKLDQPQQIDQACRQMLNNRRSQAKFDLFFQTWLDPHVDGIAKDEEAFPAFSPRLVADLKTSLRMQVDEIVWSEASDFRQLLTSDSLFANQRLADFYNLERDNELPPEDFTRIKISDGSRYGLLTHPLMMTGLAYHNDTSPIHRGVFVAKRLLGRQLRQPPMAVKPLTEEFAPEMTTRQRVEHQTKDTACMNCHSVINPLGFCLENFDAVGRFRVQDDDRPIDTTAEFRTREGRQLTLTGAADLAQFLVDDRWAQRNFIRQLFLFYVKQPIDAYGMEQLDQIHERFVERNFSIRDLIVDITMVVCNHELALRNETESALPSVSAK